MSLIACLIFIAAAFLEVSGDAVTRSGLRNNRWIYVLCGALLLGLYGIVVNTMRWDFSKLIGAYVAFFALMSVLAGALFFREHVPSSTWIGLGVIMLGGLIIQFGSK